VVDLWHVDLRVVESDGLQDLLCVEEHERAKRILSQRRRVRWAHSRGVLRALLSRYLDCDARELRFELGPHGKPALRGAPSAWTRSGDGLGFNLSHSGSLMLVAVTAGQEVGVDIERTRERYTAEFLRAWTMREAITKCRGLTLAAPSPSSPETELWTTELDLSPRAAAALAVKGGRHELRCWDYNPPVRVACSTLTAKALPGSPNSALPPFQI
jgi:phosphopantetheinyl transferase